MKRRDFIWLGVAGLISLAATPATARRRRSFSLGGGMVGRGNYDPDVLSESQLETCVRSEREIDSQEAKFESAEYDAARQQLEDLSRKIDISNITVDRYSQASIDEHNALIDTYNKLLGDFEPLESEYNSKAESFGLLVDRFNRDCAGKRYYDSDMQAVIRRLGP